ncbi:hypothetical protein GOQ27_13145 [Clostridium sp. D2Q-11]|uniref:Uncharacterized protein n=1 Tax=Anaeromonas frigoriresistens TaxID=2683708 RepID=A0A942V018_9FIRM|nr:hypothetical protein [Anaeromonas frigoriresistens]
MNITAVKEAYKDNKVLKRLIEAYQEQATKDVINKVCKGNVVPAF